MTSITFLQAILLGVVQGATEFLPVSSSGHLVLLPWWLGWSDPGLAFDAMVHWGTLVAVVLYFRQDLLALIRGWLASVFGYRLLRLRTSSQMAGSANPTTAGEGHAAAQADGRLAWLILIGTVPAVVAGLLFEDLFTRLFAQPVWAAGFLLVTGVLLVGAERVRPTGARSLATLTLAGVLLIGVAQAFAIAPGISRSGATIAAGLLVGLRRHDAARFSFLLAIPVILGAGVLQLFHLFQAGNVAAEMPLLVLGFLAAAVTGYLAIRFLLTYLQRHTLHVFAFYCWGIGLASLALALIR